MSAASTCPNGAPAAPAAPKRDGAIHTASELRATAQERAGRRLSPLPTDPPSQLDAAAASATTRASAIKFWQRVARGTVRLSSETDALITTLRKQGLGWVEVTARIRAAHTRSIALMRLTKAHAARDHKRALRWREEYRRNKEGQHGL